MSFDTDPREEQDAEMYAAFAAKDKRIADLEAQLAAQADQEPTVWRSMDVAPKDGRMLRLLVEFDDNGTEDSEDACPTIGTNSFDHTQIDEWSFAGWDWSQDCFTEGVGNPTGWLPMLVTQPAPADSIAIVQATLEAAATLAVQWGDARLDDNGGHALRNCAEAIRAINQQTILDGMSK